MEGEGPPAQLVGSGVVAGFGGELAPLGQHFAQARGGTLLGELRATRPLSVTM